MNMGMGMGMSTDTDMGMVWDYHLQEFTPKIVVQGEEGFKGD